MITRYWDSVVWLGILNEEEGKLAVCTQLLQQAQDGDARLVCSAITLTEVVHIQGGYAFMNPDKEAIISAYFTHEYIKIRSVDRRHAEKARELVWRYHDIGLRPKDAIHAATAMIANVDVLNTYDPDLLQLDGMLPRTDGEMLKIEMPFVAQTSLFAANEITTPTPVEFDFEIEGLPDEEGADEEIAEMSEKTIAKIEAEELELKPRGEPEVVSLPKPKANTEQTPLLERESDEQKKQR